MKINDKYLCAGLLIGAAVAALAIIVPAVILGFILSGVSKVSDVNAYICMVTCLTAIAVCAIICATVLIVKLLRIAQKYYKHSDEQTPPNDEVTTHEQNDKNPQ